MPFRQIHLDFHTSEAIPGVGKDWEPANFQDMLRLGCVDSITVFAKCHHGWSYHPTEVPLSETHPSLQFDLLGAQIAAAHEIGVKTPVYISAGLDEKLVRTHTHWLRRNPDGSTTWVGWLEAGYHEFCMRSPYLDYLVAQVEEVTRRYDADGIFLDIVGPRDCCCQYCIDELISRGQDPRDPAARKELGRETYLYYARRINKAIQDIKPELRIFHNSGHITRGDREIARLDTHLELESLPTGGWGYDHFPLSARYVQGLGMEFLGMTGKFHTTWGEFGGYKHPNALRFEAALGLANGAKMSVGDQMHPCGKLDPATYALIGAAYSEVKEKESWCHDVVSVADVALLSLESVGKSTSLNNLSDAGAVRVLQEGHILYDVVDAAADFDRYQMLILPDAIPPDETLMEKLRNYLQDGGKVFATGASALDTERGEFLLDFGARYQGMSDYDPEYIAPRIPIAPWHPAAFVVYSPAQVITPAGGKILADREDPYFNRDYRHFCSHQHAPNTGREVGPAMVRTEQTVYLAFPAFRLYAEKGQNVLREIILFGIRELLQAPTLTTSLPAQGIQTVMRQPAEDRTIVHLLYAAPVRRGQGIEVIEDLLPLHDVEVNLRVTHYPKRVYLAPQNEDLPFTVDNWVLKAVIPSMTCHQMVIVE
ncbi:MAG: beta-galactosidase trimerization domain-containing protein [Armatimonadota bacterium]